MVEHFAVESGAPGLQGVVGQGEPSAFDGPGAERAHGYEAARLAAEDRERRIAAGTSFIAETVFSHASKLDLLGRAREHRYLTSLHIVLVPEDLSVARVKLRAEQGGHSVPIAKVRARYRRWTGGETAVDVSPALIVFQSDDDMEVRTQLGAALQAGVTYHDWIGLTTQVEATSAAVRFLAGVRLGGYPGAALGTAFPLVALLGADDS